MGTGGMYQAMTKGFAGGAVGPMAPPENYSSIPLAKAESPAERASGIISGTHNAVVADDGSSSQSASARVEFPSGHKTDVPMPTLDKSLKGSKVFYLFNDQTGGGFKYQKFTVAGAKKPKL